MGRKEQIRKTRMNEPDEGRGGGEGAYTKKQNKEKRVLMRLWALDETFDAGRRGGLHASREGRGGSKTYDIRVFARGGQKGDVGT